MVVLETVERRFDAVEKAEPRLAIVLRLQPWRWVALHLRQFSDLLRIEKAARHLEAEFVPVAEPVVDVLHPPGQVHLHELAERSVEGTLQKIDRRVEGTLQDVRHD